MAALPKALDLGLPIVKSIAEAHGGELICQSALGQGMVAAIWIPEMSTGSKFERAA